MQNIIRNLALKLLKITAKDVVIKHHYTGSKFKLNSYNHKGYWYHGRKREEETVSIFQKWIAKDNFVLEIGGHIGYFTTFYTSLVGENGKVTVFEPSNINLNYLRSNINFLPSELSKNVIIEQKGAGDIDGELDFYIDPISGQNNSFVKDFDGFKTSRELSVDKDVETIIQKVPVTTLDGYFANKRSFPDFVKIDVEGFEWNVIRGFMKTIERCKPSIMIEIQSNADEIIAYFKSIDYQVYNDKLEEILSVEDYYKKKSPNIFFKSKNNSR